VDVEVSERAGWRPIDVARAFIGGGATFLQLRAKSLASGAFLDLAGAIAEIATSAGAQLIVNDRADIARLAGAHGVHVGQDDLSPDAVRRIVGHEMIVGVSTHTVEQLDAACRAPIDYAAVGPVFKTTSKATGYSERGVERVREAARRAAAIPLVAIGGVTIDTAPSVIEAGAAAVAVISDLLITGDPEGRARAYLERLNAI
jgi:thiamine-phosphate pyrophosphorylase